MPRSPAVSGGSRSPVPARRCRPSWGQEGAVSGAAGSAAVSSAGAAGAADAAGSSFTLWLGADGCAADAAVLSASEDAESFFGVSVLFFFVSFLVLWAASVSPSHSRADGSTVRPAGWDAAGLWCQPPTAMASAITAEATIWPAARRVFFFGVPVSFCLIPLALPPSCILTRPLAARSASNAIYTSIVYTQPQAPVNVLWRLVRGVSWKFSTIADTPCGKEPSRRIIASKRKKVQFRTGFLHFPLAVLTRVWYHDGHAAFAAL